MSQQRYISGKLVPTPEQRAAKNAKQREWRKRTQRLRADSLRQRYGIDEAKYQQMVDFQGGKCALCGGTDKDRWGRFHVDHDHATMKLRALLCPGCNLLLGVYEKRILPNLAKIEAYIHAFCE